MYTPNLYTAKQDSMSLSTSYRALVTYSNSSTGEIRVKIPALLGADSEVTISEWGRSPINGTWIVPSVGSKIVVTADDTQLTNVFWVQTDGDLATSVLKLVCPVGTIAPYAGATAPTGWLLCDGAEVSRATYADLFALIGTTYGVGNGTTTFNLPDMKGRVPVGKAATGTFAALNNKGGAETHTLTTAEMPSHAHTADGDLTAATAGGHGHTASSGTTGSHSHTGTVDSGGFHQHGIDTRNTTSTTHTHQSGTRVSVGASAANETDTTRYTNYDGTHTHTFTSAANGDHSHTVTVNSGGSHSHDITGSTSNTGGGGAHNNLQPYIVVNYIIKHDY